MDFYWFFPLFCLVFMIGMIFMMFRRGGCMSMSHDVRTGRGEERETPRQILDRRFAKGEIANDQYEALKRALRSGGTT